MAKLRKDRKLELLASVPLFRGLSKKELTFIGQEATEMSVAAGTAIITEGEMGRQAMIIISGTAVVRRKGRKVGELGPGSIVGEMSLVTRLPRNATVVASSDLDLLVMDRREFTSVLATSAKTMQRVLETVAERVAENDRSTI